MSAHGRNSSLPGRGGWTWRMATALACALCVSVPAMAAHAKHAKNVKNAPTAPTATPSPAHVAHAAAVPGETQVTVERLRPTREKFPTLRFLKENRDFLRSRFDRLRSHPTGRDGAADDIDPRFLAYRKLVAEARSSGQLVATTDDAAARTELFRSVTELGQLESQLDLMERQLGDQRSRLGTLQEDFAGHQRTALDIVLSGFPQGSAVSSVIVKFEDGATLTVPLTADQRISLQQGSFLQIFDGLVEPREQVFEVTLVGDPGTAGPSGFISLEPSRNRLNFLRLDLSSVRPAEGAPSMLASTWVLEGGLQASDGTETGP